MKKIAIFVLLFISVIGYCHAQTASILINALLGSPKEMIQSDEICTLFAEEIDLVKYDFDNGDTYRYTNISYLETVTVIFSSLGSILNDPTLTITRLTEFSSAMPWQKEDFVLMLKVDGGNHKIIFFTYKDKITGVVIHIDNY